MQVQEYLLHRLRGRQAPDTSNSREPDEIPDPHAVMIKSIAVTIIKGLRPILSARVPAKKAPTAQPSSMDATLNPVPTASESKASCNASTVPLITPLSKPNRKPPIDRKSVV